MSGAAGRRPIIGANWKMNTVLSSAVELAEDILRRLQSSSPVDVILCPPFPNLEAVSRVIDGSRVQLGAQNLFWATHGAYTGEVSAQMLTAVGCKWVIVGHSERRHLMSESSETVNRKLHAALHGGLHVILAVGETRQERLDGHTESVLREQLELSLAGVHGSAMDRVVIAYEPVWAIGTGETATVQQVGAAHAFVRTVVAELFSPTIAGAIRIQYGGSVTGANAAELMSCPDVDGALVGGASLKPHDFAAIVAAAG